MIGLIVFFFYLFGFILLFAFLDNDLCWRCFVWYVASVIILTMITFVKEISIVTLLFIHTWSELFAWTQKKDKWNIYVWNTVLIFDIHHTICSFDVSAILTSPESIHSWKWTPLCIFAFGIYKITSPIFSLSQSIPFMCVRVFSY